MSRIDEALKRAAEEASSADPSFAQRDRFALATKPRTRVEDFVTEGESSMTRETRPVVVLASIENPASTPSVSPPSVSPPSKPPDPSPSLTSFLSRVPEVVERKLVSLQGTDPTSVEQYRRLAATLHGLQQQNGIKVLMVTSAVPREGKTLTSTNLALTLSESYQRRVLLVDGDLRRPFVHEIFGIRNDTGLGDGLRVDGASLPLMQIGSHLTVLPAGRPDSDPMAALASERMRAILREAAARFDWIILDTPPVGLLSDASLMAGLVDGVIFVIGAGSTNVAVVDRALTAIGRDRVIGTVLNGLDRDATPELGYYSGYSSAQTT
jgi:capsular exopolysaccharide synthesis family protein